MKRIIVYSHKIFRRTHSGYQTDGAFSLQIDELAKYWDQLVLCVPVLSDCGFHGIGLKAKNVSIYPLPYFQGVRGFLKKSFQLRREILASIKEFNMGLVVLPGYLGILVSYICQKKNFPIFQWVVGDWGRNVLVRRKGWMVWVGIILKPVLDFILSRLTRDVLTFFNGQILYKHNKSHHHVRVSSSISARDIFDTSYIQHPLSPPFQLLFVGRLSREKGIVHLLSAVASADCPTNYHINIVGDGPLLEMLIHEVQRLDITHLVTFHGYIPWGEELLTIYRQKDIFVLPALQDQQPKVLLEAMAQSLPIVATRVGGIPTLISDGENGILVPPANPKALLEGIQRLLLSEERERLINNGLAFVRERTIEQETLRMVRVVEQYFHPSAESPSEI